MTVVPSHLARFSRLIGSSIGGLSLGGFLGANFLGSWTCSVSAMADVCGIILNGRIVRLLGCALTSLKAGGVRILPGYGY